MKDITLNFGAIRDSISRLTSQEIIKESSSDSLKQFIQTVKKSPVLMKQHLVFKNFEDCKPFSKENLAERFINQNLSILNNVKWDSIIKENRDLRISLLGDSHVESDKGAKNELFNHIHTLIESTVKPNYTQVNKSQESYEFLLEYLTRKIKENENEKQSLEESEMPNFNNWEYITKMALNNFNKRYKHLNEDDKKVFKILISSPDKKINYIKDLKNENLKMIENLLKENQTIKDIKLLEDFRTKLISENEFKKLPYDDYVIAYLELNENLKKIKTTI